MREIKFRAWDKEYKKMYSWDYVDNHLNFNNIIKQDSPFIVMQYTGLKDENGKEIYEGDILQNWAFTGKPDFSRNIKIIGEVIFEDGKFCLNTSESSWKQLSLSAYQLAGNIYENPELVKK